MCNHLTHTIHDEDGFYFLSDAKRKQLPVNIDLDAIYDAVINNVQSGNKNKPKEDRAIIQEQYAQFREGVKEGYGKLAVQVEYGGANFSMLKNLQTNVAVFSAFKKHDMMKEMAKLLIDESGKQKNKQQFVQDAKKLVTNYREQYLRNEYDAAVRGSRMASVWEQIQRSKRLYPNIEYTISRSANKRQDHIEWVGIVLPIDHPWWSIHFPPNGYGCKCGARPTDKQPTEIPEGGEVHPAFAFNPGKDGHVFDVEAHPYAQLPQKEYKAALHEARGASYHFEKTELTKKWKEKIQGKAKVDVEQLQKPVQFNSTSLEKNMRLDNGIWERLNLLSNIKEVLQDAQYLYDEEPKKKKQHVSKYHVFSYTKNSRIVTIYIEERKTGDMFLYSLHTKKNSL